MTSLNVGVIGYSEQDFNRGKARRHLSDAFDKIQEEFLENPTVVSGLTNLGIPKLAYQEATNRGWRTVGIACKKAEEYELYPVDETIIKDEWEEWGDESDAFLSRINVLIRVGGGSQAKDEIAKARNRGIKVIYEGEC